MYHSKIAGIIFFAFIIGCFPRIDREPPTVEIFNPANGETVSDSQNVWIIAEDDDQVARVELYVDDSLLLTMTEQPWDCHWVTYVYANNSTHRLLAMAYDRQENKGVSDTVTVTVINSWITPLPINDGFEGYAGGDYPWDGGWKKIVPYGNASVVSGIAHSGTNSFMLTDYSDIPEADGFYLYLANVNTLVYECAIMIPSGTNNNGLVGFYRDADAIMLNCVRFGPSDSLVVTKGLTESITGFVWHYDTWYMVKVQLNYTTNHMSVWIDNQLISSITSAPRDTTNTFCLALTRPPGSPDDCTAYFDDVKIYKVGNK